MKTRCYNPNIKGFHNHGGRGITVCERWLNSFENFYADMGARPPGHSLDRINNDGNYEPSNCRWATQTQQIRNRRKTVRIEFNEQRLTACEWAEKLGVNEHTLEARLRKPKWTVEQALFRSVRPRRTIIEYNGDKVSLAELAAKHNISPSGLRKRLKGGLSIEEALALPKTPGIKLKRHVV